MIIGLISDTHDHIDHLDQAVALFNQHDVDTVLHAGDYCSPFMIPPFEGLNLQGVFGNNDGDHYMLLQKFRDIDAVHLGTFGNLELDGCKIALYHGTDAPITAALEQSSKYDVVVTGHTHEQKAEMVDGTLSVNPGTAHGFGDTASVALLDTADLDLKFLNLN